MISVNSNNIIGTTYNINKISNIDRFYISHYVGA